MKDTKEYKKYISKILKFKLTKDIRHKVYIKALEIYENRTYNSCTYDRTICRSIMYALVIISGIEWNDLNLYNLDPFKHINLYPELEKHKPEVRSNLWFVVDDTESRIKVLKQCIEDSKPRSKVKA